MKGKTIFVVCPYGMITGGPDALGELVFYLKKSGFNAKLAYTFIDNLNYPIPKQYQSYFKDYILFKDIEDKPDQIIILPEIFSYLSNRFKLSKVFIWWLSVDNNLKGTSVLSKINFLIPYPLRLIKHIYLKDNIRIFTKSYLAELNKTKYQFKKEKENVSHLCASYYALDYVSKRTHNPCYKLIEPIDKCFLDNSVTNKKAKEDIIIYNPIKSGSFVNKIKGKAPYLTFVPLKGMSQEELIDNYKKAKLYIDFGPFPGAERMPKEAVINDCIIITGKNGASAFYEDVPIPDEFKFDSTNKNIDAIINKIIFSLKNYNDILPLFKKYKDTVINLENGFTNSLINIFN